MIVIFFTCLRRQTKYEEFIKEKAPSKVSTKMCGVVKELVLFSEIFK